MKIKNNRKNFVNLQYRVGNANFNKKIGPSEVVDLPKISDLNQVRNVFLFNIGNLSVVKAQKKQEVKENKSVEPVEMEEVVETELEIEAEETEEVEELEDDSTEDTVLSKVEYAFDKAKEFISSKLDSEEDEENDDDEVSIED